MKNSFYISFGIWIAIIPFFGIPGVWKNALMAVSGIFLIIISVGPILLKKIQSQVKGKPRKRAVKQEVKADELILSSKPDELRFSGNKTIDTKVEDKNEIK